VPYRTAWDRVREMEQRLQRRLLERESGGADGGGSRLTDEARDLIARFHRVTAGIGGEVERRFGQEFGNDDL
ncbi:MAG: LysR family transcriptional regulator, partial [Chloroflexota bacterium]|nr:LysR family transcriptional regulator [Chloroflexota bacterium]